MAGQISDETLLDQLRMAEIDNEMAQLEDDMALPSNYDHPYYPSLGNRLQSNRLRMAVAEELGRERQEMEESLQHFRRELDRPSFSRSDRDRRSVLAVNTQL